MQVIRHKGQDRYPIDPTVFISPGLNTSYKFAYRVTHFPAVGIPPWQKHGVYGGTPRPGAAQGTHPMSNLCSRLFG